jgi:hypothetical protein
MCAPTIAIADPRSSWLCRTEHVARNRCNRFVLWRRNRKRRFRAMDLGQISLYGNQNETPAALDCMSRFLGRI